jgi:hypothetical protein
MRQDAGIWMCEPHAHAEWLRTTLSEYDVRCVVVALNARYDLRVEVIKRITVFYRDADRVFRARKTVEASVRLAGHNKRHPWMWLLSMDEFTDMEPGGQGRTCIIDAGAMVVSSDTAGQHETYTGYDD